MKKYEEIKIEFRRVSLRDIVTVSPDESADDMGGWYEDWFSQENG